MITWLTANQLFWTFIICRARKRAEDDVSDVCFEIMRAVTVLATAVPAVYAVGWLLLPAWGLGAIPFGGR